MNPIELWVAAYPTPGFISMSAEASVQSFPSSSISSWPSTVALLFPTSLVASKNLEPSYQKRRLGAELESAISIVALVTGELQYVYSYQLFNNEVSFSTMMRLGVVKTAPFTRATLLF